MSPGAGRTPPEEAPEPALRPEPATAPQPALPERALPQPAATVEARGVLCPVPIIRLARAAAALPAGSLVALLTDDPAAEHDVPAWCRLRGHALLESLDLARAADPEPVDRAPDGTAPDGTAPDGTAPDGTAPDGTAPDGSAHVGTGPEPSAPNPRPGQSRRHLIRLGAPSEPG